MDTQQVWDSLEIAKFIASLATPIVVALTGLWINGRLKASDRRFEEAQQERRDKLQAEVQERKDRRQAEEKAISDERYRLNAPHIELKLNCQFHGIRGSNYLATLTVSAANVGQVLHQFEQITLRVRGIKDEPFEYFDESARRVAFPHKLLQTNLVPATWNFVFIEPGVTQYLSLTTPIPIHYSYLLAHVAFEYKEYWPHTGEAVFAVPARTL